MGAGDSFTGGGDSTPSDTLLAKPGDIGSLLPQPSVKYGEATDDMPLGKPALGALVGTKGELTPPDPNREEGEVTGEVSPCEVLIFCKDDARLSGKPSGEESPGKHFCSRAFGERLPVLWLLNSGDLAGDLTGLGAAEENLERALEEVTEEGSTLLAGIIFQNRPPS